MARHLELEHKYDADAGFTVPDLREVPGCASVGEPVTHTLLARYYDTEDLALARRGITLRRRTGGDDAGWHLKLPAAEHTKLEIHAPLGDTVPPNLADLVAAHVRGRALIPVAELETRRTERALLADDGRVLAELADDAVHGLRPGREGVLAWREIEVEAVEGGPAFLTAVGKRLRSAGARPASSSSKLARVLGDPVRPVFGGSAGPAGSAGEVLVAFLGEQLEQVLTYDPAVRLADHDDDTVHRMRVATRRIRSLLRTHHRLVEEERAGALEVELKWLADALGEVRDIEVMRVRLHDELGALPGAHQSPEWLIGMAAAERRARSQLLRTLLTRRYFALLSALETFVADPPLTSRAGRPAAKETPKVVRAAWRTMLRRHAEARRLPPSREQDLALHRTRRAAKRARYTAEAASLALGPSLRKQARRAEEVQEVLGAHQDAVVTSEYLTRVAGRPGLPPADVFVLGRLTERQHYKAVDALTDLPAAIKKASKPKRPRALGFK